MSKLDVDFATDGRLLREALIELRDDGFFPGKPSFSTEHFHGCLPA